MRNDYEIRGDITVIFLSQKSGTTLETIIDTVDLPRAQEFPQTWYASWDKLGERWYVFGGVYDSLKRKTTHTVKLHRWLYGKLPKTVFVDHKNHDTLDNRRSKNLRPLKPRENSQNRYGESKNKRIKVGQPGVSWSKYHKKWGAKVKFEGKNRFLGYYDDVADAIKVVREFRATHLPYSKEATDYL